MKPRLLFLLALAVAPLTAPRADEPKTNPLQPFARFVGGFSTVPL